MTRSIASLVEDVAEATARYPLRVWHWGDSVAFDGLLAADQVLGSRRYEGIAYGVGKGWVARSEPFRVEDQTAPGAALTEIAEREGDAALHAALVALAGFLRSRRRTAGDVFTHFDNTPVVDGDQAGEGPGVFVDCMHFDGPFFSRLARFTNDSDLAEEAVRQLMGQVALLRDEETGLFHHFWLERSGRSNGIAWGRGQGWALLGLVETLQVLPKTIGGRNFLERAVLDHARTMLAWQLADGGWANVVDDTDSFEETSTGCFMVAAMGAGMRLGILGREEFEAAVMRAWERVVDTVRDDGMVAGSSAGTPPGFGLSHYRAIAPSLLSPWGQGPFLLAAREVAAFSDTAVSQRVWEPSPW